MAKLTVFRRAAYVLSVLVAGLWLNGQARARGAGGRHAGLVPAPPAQKPVVPPPGGGGLHMAGIVLAAVVLAAVAVAWVLVVRRLRRR